MAFIIGCIVGVIVGFALTLVASAVVISSDKKKDTDNENYDDK